MILLSLRWQIFGAWHRAAGVVPTQAKAFHPEMSAEGFMMVDVL